MMFHEKLFALNAVDKSRLTSVIADNRNEELSERTRYAFEFPELIPVPYPFMECKRKGTHAIENTIIMLVFFNTEGVRIFLQIKYLTIK